MVRKIDDRSYMVEIPEGTRYRRVQYHLRKIAEPVEEIEVTTSILKHAVRSSGTYSKHTSNATSRGARIPQGWGVVAPSLPPLATSHGISIFVLSKAYKMSLTHHFCFLLSELPNGTK